MPAAAWLVVSPDKLLCPDVHCPSAESKHTHDALGKMYDTACGVCTGKMLAILLLEHKGADGYLAPKGGTP